MLMSVSAVTQNGFDTVLPCQRLWTFKQVGFWLVWLSVTFARRLVGRLHYAEYSPCRFPPFVIAITFQLPWFGRFKQSRNNVSARTSHLYCLGFGEPVT